MPRSGWPREDNVAAKSRDFLMDYSMNFDGGSIVDLVGSPAGPALRRYCRGPWGPIRRAKAPGYTPGDCGVSGGKF